MGEEGKEKKKAKTESILRVEQIKPPTFAVQKQSPNLISYHEFEPLFLLFSSNKECVSKRERSGEVERGRREEEKMYEKISSFRTNSETLKTNQAAIAGKLRGFFRAKHS